MRFFIIRFLLAGAFLLLISVPVQAQLSAEAPRVPRTADIADLAFEPSDPLAGPAISLPEGRHLEYQLLDAGGG